MVILALAIGALPFLIVFFALTLDIDVAKYLIDEYEYVSDPHYRTGFTSLGIMVLRAGIVFVPTLELWRTGSWAALVLVLIIDHTIYSWV